MNGSKAAKRSERTLSDAERSRLRQLREQIAAEKDDIIAEALQMLRLRPVAKPGMIRMRRQETGHSNARR